MQDTYNVVERNLWEFLQQIEIAVKQGYTLSDENKHFPQAHISLFTVTLVKEPVAEVDTVVADVTTAIPQKINGRKKVK